MSLNSSNRGNYVDSALFLSPPGNWGGVVGAMKPGSHLLLFSNVNKHHVGAIAAEDAGLEIRDTLAWVFSDESDYVGVVLIAMARKPLEGTVAENVMKWGTGGINVDRCRIQAEVGGKPLIVVSALRDDVQYQGNSLAGRVNGSLASSKRAGSTDLGRWPANLIHSGDDSVVELFPSPHGAGHPNYRKMGGEYNASSYNLQERELFRYGDSGSAARFFYSAPCLNDLCSYLIRLVTPPDGTVLTSPNFPATVEGFHLVEINC